MKDSKAITLIALIITVVVLLILAVVTIGQAQDSNIVGYAQNAADLFEDRQKQEEAKLKEYEEQLRSESLKQFGGEYVVYGPKNDGTWIIKTAKNIILYQDKGITTHDYKGYNVEDAINLMGESEREAATDTANQLIENYGEINQVIIATQMELNWTNIEVTGVHNFAFGIVVDNNSKLLVLDSNRSDLTIKEVITLNSNLPNEVEKLVRKSSGACSEYVIEDAPIIKGINDADYVMVIDWENETLGLHLYSEEMGGSMGMFTEVSIEQNDTAINVTLNGENKIIDSTFYKVTDSSGNIFYLDNNKEKLYKRSIDLEIGVVEKERSVIEMEISDYNLNNIGYI